MSETLLVECANCGDRETFDGELPSGTTCDGCNYEYSKSGYNRYYPDR